MSDSAGAAAASEPGSEPKHDDGDDDARASELPTEEEGAPVAEVTKAPEVAEEDEEGPASPPARADSPPPTIDPSSAPAPASPPAPPAPTLDTSPTGLLPVPTPSSPTLSQTSQLASPVPSLDESVPVRVYGVLLVGFDHALGPTVEFSHPPELNHNEQLLAEHLPFFALPDGAHARDEDYSYFHLLLPSVAPDTIFGISCNRQISSDQLINKGKDVTRSTVQKAIVVLASKPIFGPLRDKLGVITRAFFAQMDFEDKSILVDLYSSLEIPVEPRVGPGGSSGANEDGEMYMGTSLRELVHKFRFKTLMLLKLLMLQRRTMFYAAHTPIESLCTFQYSLVSLIPSLLTHLEDSASPKLDQRSQHTVKPTSLRTSDKHSLIRYLGLPLNVFGEGSFFQPYLPLQQIDMLKTRSFLVGTSNSIFQQQRDCHIDVIVNIETASLEILNPKLVPFITLTAADRKWMDEIVTTVDNSWNASDPSRPAGMNFVGSDDFIRAKFEEYICSLLACIKFDDFLAKGERGNVLLSGNEVDRNLMASFNDRFVDAFKATPAFTLWDATTDSVIFDLVEPKHPMEGKTNPIEDVGIRLAHGLHDLHLEENLAPTREAISRGLTSGSDSLWKTYSFLRTDLGKRQAEYRERLDTSAPPAVLAHTVLAGVDVAKTGAATIATGIGSFLSSSRRSLFAGRATTPDPTSSFASTTDPSPSPPPSRALTPTPPGETRYPPRPSPTPDLPSFFRPLSTSSLATSPSVHPTPPRETPSANFFNAFRRSFIEPSSSHSSSASSPAPSIKSQPPSRPNSAPLTPPPVLPAPAAAAESEEGADDEEEIEVRDLDKEYAARGGAGKVESVKEEEEDSFEVVEDPRRRRSATEESAKEGEDDEEVESDTLLSAA